MQHLIGHAHSELFGWLSKTWFREGPPVCFVEGFPGVGKSSLARSLMQVVQSQPDWVSVMVAMPEGETDPVNDLLLDLGSELSWAGHDKIADAVSEGKSLEHALAVVLRRPILIIVDEFQRAFLQDSGQPIKPLEQIFQKLANRPNIPGRMLLLTNRLVEQGQWSEPYVTRRLTALAAAEAEQLLGQLLREKNLDEEVSGERRRAVVHWLGCNPRAIRVLVENLERESLDELIGINPQSWELRDREVSEGLVYDLEKKLLERTLSHLSTETETFLKQISVYRKPPKRQAMEMVISKNKKDKKVFDTRFEELRNRFLIERQDSWYNLHPVAREIALQRLKENAVGLREAHSKAADFYIRPFQAQEIKGGKLGGSFVEARYHLVQARREVELGQISHNFKNHLQATISNRSIPTQSDELDESIAVFSVLVESTASEESERYLAQLLQTRGNEGDLQQALLHTKRATDLGFQVESWLLRADLEQQMNDSEAALATYMEGISRVSANEDVYQLYNYCTELLIQLGRPSEAINLLEAGIYQVVPEQGLSSLYQLGTELLTQVGQIERAISWLKVGIDRMLPGQRLASLYQHCANLLFQSNQLNEAINLLQEGIERISPEQGLVSLYQCYGELLSQSNQLDKAIGVLKEGIHSIPPKYNPFALYQSCAELLVQSGEVDKAIELLKTSFQNLLLEQSLIELYERWGNLLAKLGQTDGAIALLKEGICNIPPARGPVALYLRCGEVLVESGQVNEAIDLLESGIRKIPAERSHTILYERCGALLVQVEQNDKAIALFKDGIRDIRNQKAQLILYKCCAEVLEKSDQGNEAVALLKQGIRSIPNDDTRRILYLDCAALLKRIDQLDAAIELLHQGINRIPPDKSLFVLYQTGSKILCKTNRVRDAIQFLKEGIHNIPLDQGNRHKLIETAMLLCLASQNKSELEKLLAGTGKNSLSAQSAILGKVLLAQMQQNWQQAAETAEQGAIKFPVYLPLIAQAAFSWFCAGNTDKAKQTLQNFRLQPKQGLSFLWLKAWVELKHGERKLGTESLSAYLGRPIQELKELNETFLLALWDNSIDAEEENNLAFHFPTLPPSLTGLDKPVTRLQFSPPILSGILKTMSPTQPTTQRTQVFISYSHKDKVWLQKLQTHLTPFIRGQYLYVWDDTQILPGSKWKEEIEKALASAKIAVLLVTPDFLASKFIHEQELPPLLEASEREGLTILWIPVRSSSYKITKINDYQAAHNPSKPLSSLNDAEQDDAWVSICDRIQEAFES